MHKQVQFQQQQKQEQKLQQQQQQQKEQQQQQKLQQEREKQQQQQQPRFNSKAGDPVNHSNDNSLSDGDGRDDPDFVVRATEVQVTKTMASTKRLPARGKWA